MQRTTADIEAVTFLAGQTAPEWQKPQSSWVIGVSLLEWEGSASVILREGYLQVPGGLRTDAWRAHRMSDSPMFSIDDVKDVVGVGYPQLEMTDDQACQLTDRLNASVHRFVGHLRRRSLTDREYEASKRYEDMQDLRRSIKRSRQIIAEGQRFGASILTRLEFERLKRQVVGRLPNARRLAEVLGKGDLNAGLKRLVEIEQAFRELHDAAIVVRDQNEMVPLWPPVDQGLPVRFGHEALYALEDVLDVTIGQSRPRGAGDSLNRPAGPAARFLDLMFAKLRDKLASHPDGTLSEIADHPYLRRGDHTFARWTKDFSRQRRASKTLGEGKT